LCGRSSVWVEGARVEGIVLDDTATVAAVHWADLPVGQLARGDCLLLLWTCGWAMATGQAQAVARAWGFKPQSEMIWRKLTANGKPRMGTGYRVRTLHEPILAATMLSIGPGSDTWPT
jgi:N6-adenosine-specific RNA methylase IME4